MEHAAFVRGSQSSADFARELDGFVLRQTTDAADQRGQVFPSRYSIEMKSEPSRNPMS